MPPHRLSGELAAWARAEGDRTLGGLFARFGRRAFALSFVLKRVPRPRWPGLFRPRAAGVVL